MPSKKKKYNARFPAGRIKKIMQTDEEVGKVAQAVPIIISRTLELFVESLLTKAMQITQARSAKTLTPSHMKQCILSESRFDFLKDLVKEVPDPSAQEDNENNEKEADYLQNKITEQGSKPPQQWVEVTKDTDVLTNIYTEQGTSSGRTPSVIQYSPKVTPSNFSIDTLVTKSIKLGTKCELDLSAEGSTSADKLPSQSQPISNVCKNQVPINTHNTPFQDKGNVPPLIPITQTLVFPQNTGDNLYIDEDYDN